MRLRTTRRERTQRKPAKGFLLIAGLFVLTALLTLTTVGLTRSMTELAASSKLSDVNRAFQVTEAGLDEALQQLTALTPTQLNSLLASSSTPPGLLGSIPQTTPCPLPHCTVRVSNNPDDGGGAGNDTDRVVIVTAQGQLAGVRQQVTARVLLPLGVFDWGVLAWNLDVQDTASLGTGPHEVPIFLDSNFTTPLHNDVWGSGIKFYSSAPSCPDCYPAVQPNFHGAAVSVSQDLYATTFPTIAKVNLNPYYNQAQSQSGLDCEGRPYHHITSDTVIDGSQCAGGTQVLDGVIYVERGKNLDFKGNVEVRGTIVHEGVNQLDAAARASAGIAGPYDLGRIKVLPGAHVTIDSYAGTPFAPGVAILGQPSFVVDPPAGDTTTSLTMEGFAIVGGSMNANFYNPSVIGGSRTTIDGGVFVLCHDGFWNIPMNVDGPGTTDPVNFSGRFAAFHPVFVKGQASIRYRKPPKMPPGFSFGTGNSSSSHAMLLSWQVDEP